MPEFLRRGNHLIHRRIVRDAGHRRARAHHVTCGAAVQADDLQDDFLFRFAERALLESHLEEFLVLTFRQSAGYARTGNFFEEEGIQPLRGSMQRSGESLEGQQDPTYAQGPPLWLAHGQSFRKHFTPNQYQCHQRAHREDKRPLCVEHQPQRGSDDCGVGEGVAQRQCRQQIIRVFEEIPDDFARAGIFFGELADLPVAQREERRFRQRKKETRAREKQNRRNGCFHGRSLAEKSPRKKEKAAGRTKLKRPQPSKTATTAAYCSVWLMLTKIFFAFRDSNNFLPLPCKITYGSPLSRCAISMSCQPSCPQMPVPNALEIASLAAKRAATNGAGLRCPRQ